MEIRIKFTNQTARKALYAIQQKHGLSYSQDLNEKRLANLIKLEILTVIAEQAQIDMERMEKLLPDILSED